MSGTQDGPPGPSPGAAAPQSGVWTLSGLPPRPSSVVRARHGVREVLARWEADDLEWVVSQLLSEVVTNVVLHAGTPFDLVVRRTGDRVRCEVVDGDPRPPRLRSHSLESATGRGMRLVDQLSAAWGVTRGPDGKTVWFEVAAPDEDTGTEPDLDALLAAFGEEDVPPPPQPGGGGAGTSGAGVCAGRGRAA